MSGGRKLGVDQYCCATCGMFMKEPCEHWRAINSTGRAEAALRAETPAPRKALQKHRYHYAEVDLVAQCSCGWKYDAPVGRSNGWDWWVIHFEATLAPDVDFAETEKAIRNLSWDEPCNGKWTAVVRVEHVLAILRAAGEPEQAK